MVRKNTQANRKQHQPIITLILTLLLITPAIIAQATTKPINEPQTHLLRPEGWQQLMGDNVKIKDGFGDDNNVAIRGIEIYNNELYIGTENLKPFSSLREKINSITEEYNQITGQTMTPTEMEQLLNLSTNTNAKNEKLHTPNNINLQTTTQQTTPLIIEENLSDYIFEPHIFHDPRLIELIGNFGIRFVLHLRNRLSDGCELWKYNYTTGKWTQIVGDQSIVNMPAGFGFTYNSDISVLKEFNGYLYAGTWNTPLGKLTDSTLEEKLRKGLEIWRFDGATWEQVVGHNAAIKGGFNDDGIAYYEDNIAAWSIEVLNDHLYVGTVNINFKNTGGCQVWRTSDGTSWEKVVDKGFHDLQPPDQSSVRNTYTWDMLVYDGQLYVAPFNSMMLFGYRGCQLWTSDTGNPDDWTSVPLPGGLGFGEPENYAIRRLVVYNNKLFCGIAASMFSQTEACELWSYDANEPINKWNCIIGDDSPLASEDANYSDGFGNLINAYVWTMNVTSDNKLWIGTANGKINIWTQERIATGTEVWCYDGNTLRPIVKDDENAEIGSGFNNVYNVGARAMIEFPKNSNNLIVGTFNYVFDQIDIKEGAEVWIRNA